MLLSIQSLLSTEPYKNEPGLDDGVIDELDNYQLDDDEKRIRCHQSAQYNRKVRKDCLRGENDEKSNKLADYPREPETGFHQALGGGVQHQTE